MTAVPPPRVLLLARLSGARQKLADGCSDLPGVGFKGEMAGVEEAHCGVRYVALERLRARRQKEGIVLSPSGQQWWPICAEVGLKLGVHSNVAFVVAEQVELHIGNARSASR